MGDDEFLSQIEQIAHRIAELEASGNPGLQEATREIVDGVLEFHRVAVGRLLTSMARQSEQFQEAMAAIAEEDSLVASLLLLHDLHPTDLRQRVALALNKIQPRLPVSETAFKILEVSCQLVRIEFEIPDQEDPAIFITTQRLLEETLLSAVPDVAAVECRPVYAQNDDGKIFLPILNSMPM